MSWTTDDGLHEGYLLPEFPDGRRGCGVTTGAVPDEQVVVEMSYDDPPPTYSTRPASEAIGWRVMCNCRSEAGGSLPESRCWTSELLERVPTRELEDLEAGRIFATDEDVAYVAERDCVDEAVRNLWWRDHAAEAEALTRVDRARTRVLLASEELDDAIAVAYAAGADTRALNNAAGVRPVSRPQSRTGAQHRPGVPTTGLGSWIR